MKLVIQGHMKTLVVGSVTALALAIALAGCSVQEIHPSKMPLSKEAVMLLGKKGMGANSPIFVRIFKEESELEVWKARDDGRFYHFKTYPICTWSGKLGPKVKQGDKQAPEGFYSVPKYQMNPGSQFHLSFNLGYPNAYDKSHGRTGNFLMVHGKCRSAGCYAMTDALIEEIYALARDAFDGGQKAFQVHAFPFRMTPQNMVRHAGHKQYRFWQRLKPGYDDFELTRVPPRVAVCNKSYLVNVDFIDQRAARRINPARACPRYRRATLVPFEPVGAAARRLAGQRIIAPGRKRRAFANGTLPASESRSALGRGGARRFGFGFNQ